jgi:hypothetical protein
VQYPQIKFEKFFSLYQHLTFAMHGAVAQRIERSFNGRGGRGFESYQRRAH